MKEIIVFSIISAIGSYWIWRIFLPYPWADILAILGGIAVLIAGYTTTKKK